MQGEYKQRGMGKVQVLLGRYRETVRLVQKEFDMTDINGRHTEKHDSAL